MLADDVQIVSVDDHVVEHPGVWTDRLPKRYSETGPRVEEMANGTQVWMF